MIDPLGSFTDVEHAVDGDLFELLHYPGRPDDPQHVGGGAAAEAEMRRYDRLREVAGAAVVVAKLASAAGDELEARAESGPVGAHALQLDREPVPAAGRVSQEIVRPAVEGRGAPAVRTPNLRSAFQ